MGNIKLYNKDNLELMAGMLDGSVDMIYCDVLYGTGINFKAYQDLKATRSEVEKHYLPRLTEMRRVLKQNGSIYLQMDTRINHWLRCLMDDIFGYENFKNEIAWCYNSQGKTTKQWNKKHDVILYYTKTNDYVFNATAIKDSITASTYKRFKREIEKKGYYTSFKNGKEYKYYLEEGSLPKDWFEDVAYISRSNKELTGYPTQKPEELIRRLVLASTNKGDVVADFYLGSGTTAVVCNELNRNFIGCDLNADAIDITEMRLKGYQTTKRD